MNYCHMHQHLTVVNFRKNKLYKLRKQVGVESVRKNKAKMTTVEKVQAVVDFKESDVLGKWGVTAVKQRLANEGVLMSR